MVGVILFLIAVLILLLLFLRIGICIKYEDGVFVFLKILFLSFTLYPNEKKVNVKEFSAKGISKKLKKDSALIAKRKSNEEKKKEKKVQKKFSDITETLKLVADILSQILGRFLKYLRIRVAKIKVIVATDDAAKTAMQYGLAVQGVQYIVTILENVTKFSVEKDGNITVDCDFCSEKPTIDLDLSFSIRIWQVLALLLRAGAVLVTRRTTQIKN